MSETKPNGKNGSGKTDHEKWTEFWEIAKDWRPRDCKRPGAAAREFHRRIKEGVDPDEILRGARNYTAKILDIDYPLSPHNWLIDWCWQEYQEPVRRSRPLTPEEQEAWRDVFQQPPSWCWIDEGFCGPPAALVKRFEGYRH